MRLTLRILALAALTASCAHQTPAPPPLFDQSDATLVLLRFPVTTWPIRDKDAEQLARELLPELEGDLAEAGFRIVGPEAARVALEFKVNILYRGIPGGGTMAHYELGDQDGPVSAADVLCEDFCNRPGQNARSFAKRIVGELRGDPGLAKYVANKKSSSSRKLLAGNSSTRKGRMAVLDIRDFAGLKPETARYFADLIREATLNRVPGVDVMTRENTMVLLQASGKDLANCEGECEVDTGRRIGADAIISGELQKVGSNYKLSLRLHETKEGKLLSAVVSSGKDIDELDKDARTGVARLLEPLR